MAGCWFWYHRGRPPVASCSTGIAAHWMLILVLVLTTLVLVLVLPLALADASGGVL